MASQDSDGIARAKICRRKSEAAAVHCAALVSEAVHGRSVCLVGILHDNRINADGIITDTAVDASFIDDAITKCEDSVDPPPERRTGSV
jgi:hypothetical protein